MFNVDMNTLDLSSMNLDGSLCPSEGDLEFLKSIYKQKDKVPPTIGQTIRIASGLTDYICSIGEVSRVVLPLDMPPEVSLHVVLHLTKRGKTVYFPYFDCDGNAAPVMAL